MTKKQVIFNKNLKPFVLYWNAYVFGFAVGILNLSSCVWFSLYGFGLAVVLVNLLLLFLVLLSHFEVCCCIFFGFDLCVWYHWCHVFILLSCCWFCCCTFGFVVPFFWSRCCFLFRLYLTLLCFKFLLLCFWLWCHIWICYWVFAYFPHGLVCCCVNIAVMLLIFLLCFNWFCFCIVFFAL